MRPDYTLKALDPYWQSIQAGAARATNNLSEVQPCDTLLDGPDEAVSDQAAIDRCVKLINNEIVRLHGLIGKWDYTTAGEYGDPRETAESWENKHAIEGCTSCGREGVMVFMPCDPKQRAGLCTWCGKFQTSTGYLPTPLLLQVHHAGKKMTNALVDYELKPLREAEAKRRATTRTTRKKGKKAAA